MLIAPGAFENGHHGQQNPPEALQFVGLVVAMVAMLIILTGWGMAVCILFAGRFLSRRRHYTFCLIMAALSCMITPFGTVLGVFTIVVLMRPSVKLLFEPQSNAASV